MPVHNQVRSGARPPPGSEKKNAGILKHGFARVRCGSCKHEFLLAFSFKCRYFCPSCHAKRLAHWGIWLEETLLADVWHLDEVFVNIQGQRHYLWRAVDQDGEKIDILVQRNRNARAAKRFFRKLLKGQASTPWRLVTDKLKSYSAAQREVMPSVAHDTRH